MYRVTGCFKLLQILQQLSRDVFNVEKNLDMRVILFYVVYNNQF